MAAKSDGEDSIVTRIRDTLQEQYGAQHRKAKIKVYRYNSVSVRVRIVDPDFKGMSRAARDSAIWDILDALPEEVRGEISILLLVTPDETKNSVMNLEFDHPTPSRL